jgi:hypothetical protein
MNQDASRWWDGARAAAVAETVTRYSRGRLSDERFDAAMRALRSPGWVPERGPYRLPAKWAIASYWAGRDDWFDVDLEHPHCFACGLHGGHPEDEPDPAARWNLAGRLERGHIVNRARHGLDGVQNLVPLCGDCNHFMPVFSVEDDEEATAWIFAGGFMGDVERRLEAQGLNWAERGFAWLDFIAQRGGLAGVGDGKLLRYRQFLAGIIPAAS